MKGIKKILIGLSLVMVGFIVIGYFFISSIDTEETSDEGYYELPGTVKSAPDDEEYYPVPGSTDDVSSPDNTDTPPPPPPPPQIVDRQEAVESFLKKGNMGYYVPDSMEVEVPSTVSLIISKNKTLAQIEESLQTTIENEPRPDTSRITLEGISISKQMMATLYAMDTSAFSITPLSRVQQSVLLNDTAETKWEWSVKPLKAGSHKLIIRASARIYDGEASDWIDIEAYNGVVPVKAIYIPEPAWYENLFAFWKENWQLLLATFAAIGGFITWTRSTLMTWIRSAFSKKKKGETTVKQITH
ncbi:hypothetical protein ACFS7Z_22730 [Pontibacter toksunensis]|uniref:Uncharacterized protein n=1 Tax=Pontibacter toksunensis TaxID=1332631 RepID=A0ABW6BZF1_9BACT